MFPWFTAQCDNVDSENFEIQLALGGEFWHGKSLAVLEFFTGQGGWSAALFLSKFVCYSC